MKLVYVSMKVYTILFMLFLGVFVSCNKQKKVDVTTPKLFNQLTAEKTGINFSNDLTENDSLNYFTYPYLYMGGGVAAGDINNDGLIDLYFTGNMVSNKLYLNKGDLTFEDITDKAGVSGDKRWFTGVTMADVNGDGFLDIYCTIGGKFKPKNNLCYINNGNGTFTEKAKELGIDDKSNSVQGTFFDYDLDGDLDLYVANYPPTSFSSPNNYYRNRMNNPNKLETDKLYRNDGSRFTDVTNASGLRSFGLSLSATIGDVNNDGWPDIYVSNDFSTPDYFFINNQDGTFKESLKLATRNTSFYGMGTDIADYNNDGLLDVFQVDMSAENNRRAKANMASMNPAVFWGAVNTGFHYQYMQNSLQLNTGIMNDSLNSYNFSNISRLAGVSSTDWSWGPLFVDLDNDGWKDLFISNGTRKEINNRDYFIKLSKSRYKRDSLLYKSDQIPSEKIDNYVYKNKGDLTFEKSNNDWGISYEGFSNGAVYADLDNDGDLEIITNNIDDKASVFENKNSENNNYIKIQFQGTEKNKYGLGNRVYLKAGGNKQMQELTLSRGFQSSVAPELNFGINQSKSIEELKVVWTDGKTQVFKDIDANQKLVIKYTEAIVEKNPEESKSAPLFTSQNEEFFPSFSHKENEFDDFKTQVLLPHKMSSFGPALVVGDLNGDGLDDYYIGGSSGNPGVLFYQNDQGFKEISSSVLLEDKDAEDTGAMIFDADQDGDNDLYVVSGGYEFTPNAPQLQDRLYINDGKGNFSKSPETTLPEMMTSGSRVYHADFDKDGKEDILVLGRQVPGNYPKPADSYILKNVTENEHARFENVTPSWVKEFTELGLATSAVITDYNKDSWLDIIVVGEWMPIRVFRNTHSGFEEVSESMGLTTDTTGWWWSIEEGDFDNDGDMDYIVGNNGLNYKYKATEEETFDIYINDFDKNKKDDIVLSYYNEGKQYPVRGRECSSQQIPNIKQKFKNYEGFAEASLIDVYTEKSLESAVHYQVKSFASVYLENKGDSFEIHQLPVEAQMSSINQIVVNDFNADGHLDAVIAGNLYASEVETPRNDAGYGLFLKGSSNGSFNPVPTTESGLFIPGDVKDLRPIEVGNDTFIIAAKNNDFLQFVKVANDTIKTTL
ncbi:VCBS repeat-containing protein [Aquimarina addita]|uniref:VCBS repeat-containing protein n=1 Tax=Aquimarina addita TaxID=870485 RepID=A0ABP6UPB4_9FLAO